MTTSTKKFIRIRAKKPVGGYILLTVQQLCLLWWLYRTRVIQLLDFRVWCAAHEMMARRCQIAPGQVPEYTTRELLTLVGGRGGDHLRASLNRLDHLGLLTWSPPTLSFATSPQDLRHIEDFSGFAQMFDNVPNHHRRVPVPRQALRLIAGGVRPAVIATILGTCFRCLYHHSRETFPVESGGWVKSSWIAGVFQVNLRNVKAARKHLTDLGWLLTFTAPQRMQNCWGTYAQVSLTWERPTNDSVIDAASESVPETLPEAVSHLAPPPEISTPQLPPPPAFSTPQLPPPLIHSQLLQESKHQEPTVEAENPPVPLTPFQHQKPACGGLQETGVQNKTQAKKTILNPPTLRHIVPEDLESTERLLALFSEAQALQLVGTNDSARLAFVAAAEHATVIGTANSCGLFATLVRKQLWHFATEGDEDTAHARLKHYLYGTPCPEARTLPTAINTPRPLSDDALTAQSLRRDLARAGFSGDIFLLLHREYPEWTRERWEMACAELVAADAARRTTPALARLGTVTAAILEENA